MDVFTTEQLRYLQRLLEQEMEDKPDDEVPAVALETLVALRAALYNE